MTVRVCVQNIRELAHTWKLRVVETAKQEYTGRERVPRAEDIFVRNVAMLVFQKSKSVEQ